MTHVLSCRRRTTVKQRVTSPEKTNFKITLCFLQCLPFFFNLFISFVMSLLTSFFLSFFLLYLSDLSCRCDVSQLHQLSTASCFCFHFVEGPAHYPQASDTSRTRTASLFVVVFSLSCFYIMCKYSSQVSRQNTAPFENVTPLLILCECFYNK